MNQSNKALRELVAEIIMDMVHKGSMMEGGKTLAPFMFEEEAANTIALVTNHIKARLPEKKWPAPIDDIPKFTEPLIAETINSKSTIDPWVNKGYNQAIKEFETLLEEVSNGK